MNTSIPACVLVLKKQREGRDVLFIDASNLFEKVKTHNVMNPEHRDRVVELYKNRETVEKEAYLATYEDIEKNDFNLNIPRYVDTSDPEEEIDLNEVAGRIKKIDAEMKEVETDLRKSFDELGLKYPF